MTMSKLAKPGELPSQRNLHGVVIPPVDPYKKWGGYLGAGDRTLVQWACDPEPCGCNDVTHCGPVWMSAEDIVLVSKDRPPEHQPHPGPTVNPFPRR